MFNVILKNLETWMQLVISCVVVVFQLLIHLRLFVTPCTAAHQTSCPSLSPGVCSNSCPLTSWYYLTISSSAALFSFYLQSFPASGPFSLGQLFASSGQSIGSFRFSISPSVNIQGWFPLGLTGLISLQSKGLWGVFFSTTIWRHQFFSTQLLYGPTLTSVHDSWKN